MTIIAAKAKNLDWRCALSRLEGAYADATLRSYRADMEVFEAWCLRNKRRPLPASPETVAAFITEQAEKRANATIKRRLAAIRKVHRLLRLESPAGDEEVLLALRRAFRKRPSRQRQALGLTRDLRDKLIAVCPQTIHGLRDRAMIAVGYDTLCRRSELVALRVEDLQKTSRGAISILIRRSKNDQYGEGRVTYLSVETMRILGAWLKAAEIKKGYVFRSLINDRVSEAALHPINVNRILKRTARSGGFSEAEICALSGHSMRVGAAQDMIADGLGILPIMRAGGWRSLNIVGRYVECADLSNLLKRGGECCI
jgi:integrase/recombinase XerD